jgi:hypothetical protein
MASPVYLRVQNKVGRGPFIPGFSHIWLDSHKDKNLVSIMEAFPNLKEIIETNRGEHLWVACPVNWFSKWFSNAELRILKKYGFDVYDASECEIIATHPTQVIMKGNQFELNRYKK